MKKQLFVLVAILATSLMVSCGGDKDEKDPAETLLELQNDIDYEGSDKDEEPDRDEDDN